MQLSAHNSTLLPGPRHRAQESECVTTRGAAACSLEGSNAIRRHDRRRVDDPRPCGLWARLRAKGGHPNRNGGLDCARRFGDTERTCSPRPCAGQSNCPSDGFRSTGNRRHSAVAARSTAGGRADPPRPDDACSGFFSRERACAERFRPERAGQQHFGMRQARWHRPVAYRRDRHHGRSRGRLRALQAIRLPTR